MTKVDNVFGADSTKSLDLRTAQLKRFSQANLKKDNKKPWQDTTVQIHR